RISDRPVSHLISQTSQMYRHVNGNSPIVGVLSVIAMLRQLAGSGRRSFCVREGNVASPARQVLPKSDGDLPPSMWVVAILIEPKPRKGLQHVIQCLLHSHVVQLAGDARPVGGDLARHAPPAPNDLSSNVMVHEGYYLRPVQDEIHSKRPAVKIRRE